MASDNQITIVGNITDDPELRYTANGAAVANFRVAHSTRIRDAAGNWTDGDTSFFRGQLLAQPRGERRRVAHARHPRRRDRAPQAALLGEPGRARSAPSSRSRPTTSVPA